MNEQAARNVLLIRALESADPDRTLITDADRQHAARAAAELARWSASERGEAASAERFIEQRAELLVAKLGERERRLLPATRALAWPAWLGVVLPLAAFAFGALFQQFGDRQHINVLAFPLFTIVLWNLVVYLLLALRSLAQLAGRAQPASWLRCSALRLAQRRKPGMRGPLADTFANFAGEWSRASAPLMLARAARVLHVSAALLALGAVLGLYARGLVFDYRAGWESTFLDAGQVHTVLSFLLGPAASALGMPFPLPAELAALRFPGSLGERAARWIHWYALTVAALVIVPRLVLAAAAGWRERRLVARMPVDLGEPYFRRLLSAFAPRPTRLRVVPYSYTVDEAAVLALETIAKALLGDAAQLGLRPAVAFGAENAAGEKLDAGDVAVALTAALFNLAATPEHENHGAFLEVLRKAAKSPLVALVDETPYQRRLGDQPAARDRLAERRAAWSAFCSTHRVSIAFVDLAAPDLARLEVELEPLIAAPA